MRHGFDDVGCSAWDGFMTEFWLTFFHVINTTIDIGQMVMVSAASDFFWSWELRQFLFHLFIYFTNEYGKRGKLIFPKFYCIIYYKRF
jgi:hypothetical protein